MADQFNFVSTDSKVRACMKNARIERSRYVAALASGAAPRLRYPAVGTLGAAVLGLLIFASFAPFNIRSRPERASISPSELTQQVRKIPTADVVDTH
jgi:hypothetical protein